MPDTPRVVSNRRQLARDESLSWGGSRTWRDDLASHQHVSITDGAIEPARSKGPTEALVGHWEFDDPDTPAALDSVGSADATINGPTCVGTGPVGANSLQFNSSNRDSLTFTSSELDIQGSFTISVWARMDGSTPEGWQRIYQKGRSKSERTVELYVADWRNSETSGAIGFRVNKETAFTNTELRLSPAEFSSSTYYHYVAIRDAEIGELRIYRDGNFLGATPQTAAVGSNDRHTIGNWSANGARPWNGGLDDFRIYNRALPQSDVESLYKSNQVKYD